MANIFLFGDNAKRAAEMVSFARSVNAQCTALVCGDDADGFKNIAADEVIYLGNAMPESYAKAISVILKERGFSLFAVAMSASGRELAAKVAGYCDCPIVCDLTSLSSDGEGYIAERMLYGGAVIRSEKLAAGTVVTVPVGKFEPAEGACAVTELSCEADCRVSLIETAPIVREGVDITAAEKVVGAGMGFSTREELEVAYDLAKALGAEVGCSRSLAEDQHWFTEYIGLSGITLSPKLYFALGISGQVQHTVGVRGSQVIVAINRDEKAPIMTGCDYGVVGDMYELVPLIIKAIDA